jgi:hypothetical protein
MAGFDLPGDELGVLLRPSVDIGAPNFDPPRDASLADQPESEEEAPAQAASLPDGAEATARKDETKPAAIFGGLDHAHFTPQPHTGVLRYGSETIRLPFDPATDTYSFGPMRLRHELVVTIVHAAYLAGVDPRLLMAIADKESSFIVRARASTSTATGLFQFIDSTWLKAVKEFGARFGLEDEASAITLVDGAHAVSDEAARERILNMRNDPFLSTLLAASMLRHEQERLSERLARPITDAEVYLVHFLGPGGARRFLSALADKPRQPAARVLPAAAKANRPIFYATKKRKTHSLTVAQVHEKIEHSLERRLTRYRDLDFGANAAFIQPVWAGGEDFSSRDRDL